MAHRNSTTTEEVAMHPYWQKEVDSRYYWVSMTVFGWNGGRHVVDDFGNLVPVDPQVRKYYGI